MFIQARRTALLAVLFMAACAPVGEPIVSPLPQGAALDTAGRAYVRRVEPPEEYMRALAGGTRSQNGAPGPRYWQQRVRYQIAAELEPGERRITASERIVYHNNSGRELPQVIFNLYQNLFTENFTGRNSPMNTGGFNLTSFVFNGVTLGPLSQQQYEANQRENRHSAGYITTGTLSRVLLPRPIAAGDSAVFEIAWNFRVPPTGAPRTGWEDALGGRVFQVAQWYPQIAVFDDVQGYDVTPYTGQGEFYLEYGDFDVTLTLPAGWTVGATGELQNPEILRPEVRQRLQAALTADSTVHVLTAGELSGNGATGAGENGKVTWRFSARDVRDFAWAASNRYRWDARVAQVPGERGGTRAVLVNSLYRGGAPHWEESALFGDHSTEFLSRTLVPYAYPQITVSEGPVYGMEYPMVIFIGRPTARLDLYEVIAHEVGHEWHPMMVGQDEAAYAWMDEGFTTFNEGRAVHDFFRGEEDPWEEPRSAYLGIAGDKGEAPLMRNIELVFGPANGVSAYFKPGILLRSLQRALGDSVFFQGMRTFEREWMFKHPQPWDFFNTMERVAGRDLDWFWYPFWYRTVTLDQGISTVRQTAGGVEVTVRDFGQAPAPAEIVVTTSDGRRVTETIPIERWLSPSTRVATVTIPVTGTVTRVDLDPEQYFPDANRRNNVWTP